MDLSKMLRIDEYKNLSSELRAIYLHFHVGESTDLTPDFILQAIEFENAPLSKWYLIRAIGILKIEFAIDYLIDTFKETDVKLDKSSLHLIAAWSLGAIGENALDPLVKEYNRTNSEDIKKCIVDSLGEIGSPKAIPILCKAFMEESHNVKLWSSLSLSKIGNQAIEPIKKLFSRATSSGDRLMLIDAIIKIDSPRSVQFLREILEGCSNKDKILIRAILNQQ